MKQAEFDRLFSTALEQAAQAAEHTLRRVVPRAFLIRLYGAGYAGDLLEPEIAAENLYLSEDLFYRIIDVAVVEVDEHHTICFVRVSGHRPGPFEETWNTPPDSGPFKQLLSMEIKGVRPEAVSVTGA